MKKGISFTIILLALAYSQSYDNSLAELISKELSSPHIIGVEGEISIWYRNEEGFKKSSKLKIGQVIIDGIQFRNDNANQNAYILVSCHNNNIVSFRIEIPSHSRRGLLGGHIDGVCKSRHEFTPYAPKNHNDHNDNISPDYIIYIINDNISPDDIIDTILDDDRLSAKTYVKALVWARAGEYELALKVLEDYQKDNNEEERFDTLITTLERASNNKP